MSRYTTPHYARVFRDEANAAQKSAAKNRNAADFNRKTLYAVMESLHGSVEAQEAMLETCRKMGHNQTTLNALVKRMQ